MVHIEDRTDCRVHQQTVDPQQLAQLLQLLARFRVDRLDRAAALLLELFAESTEDGLELVVHHKTQSLN
jgi:hypothetical protein